MKSLLVASPVPLICPLRGQVKIYFPEQVNLWKRDVFSQRYGTNIYTDDCRMHRINQAFLEVVDQNEETFILSPQTTFV